MLHHTTLEVPKDRWSDCVAFWGLLGFAPMRPPVPLRGRFTWVAREGTQIHLADVETAVVAEVGHTAVLVPDYAGTIEALKEAGFEVNPGSSAWDAERVFVRDPVGHLIEIMSAPPVGPLRTEGVGLLIDGRAIALELKETLREELAALDRPVGIATLLVGGELGAQVYQRRIDRGAKELGIASRVEQMPADATLGQVIGKIAELDADPEISGILVLRPLPPHLPESRVFNALPVLKDVEALHPTNAGLLSLGMPRFIPSTPAAAFHMLDRHTRQMGRDPETAYDGMNLVLVGRSNNVGKPAAILGLQRNATVISAHKHTADAGRLGEHTKAADLLIDAVGVPHIITGDMVKEGSIVVDIGINATEGPDGKVVLTGDVDTETVEPVAEAVSPVPGGVGPITDVWVLRNTVLAARINEPRAD